MSGEHVNNMDHSHTHAEALEMMSLHKWNTSQTPVTMVSCAHAGKQHAQLALKRSQHLSAPTVFPYFGHNSIPFPPKKPYFSIIIDKHLLSSGRMRDRKIETDKQRDELCDLCTHLSLFIMSSSCPNYRSTVSGFIILSPAVLSYITEY